jgi:hypothetical protein
VSARVAADDKSRAEARTMLDEAVAMTKKEFNS